MLSLIISRMAEMTKNDTWSNMLSRISDKLDYDVPLSPMEQRIISNIVGNRTEARLQKIANWIINRNIRPKTHKPKYECYGTVYSDAGLFDTIKELSTPLNIWVDGYKPQLPTRRRKNYAVIRPTGPIK